MVVAANGLRGHQCSIWSSAGTVIDGTGAEPVQADVGITDGSIAEAGIRSSDKAVDATGAVALEAARQQSTPTAMASRRIRSYRHHPVGMPG